MPDRKMIASDLDESAGADPGPTAVAVAVVEDGDRLLVGQRPEGASLAGLWEFPGGKVRLGETPERAAVRECLEETGLEIEVVGSYGVTVHGYPHGWVRIHFFTCRLTFEANSLRPPFRWIPIDELDRYPFPAANARVIRHLTKSV
jgi:mutator protein MutT